MYKFLFKTGKLIKLCFFSLPLPTHTDIAHEQTKPTVRALVSDMWSFTHSFQTVDQASDIHYLKRLLQAALDWSHLGCQQAEERCCRSRHLSLSVKWLYWLVHLVDKDAIFRLNNNNYCQLMS